MAESRSSSNIAEAFWKHRPAEVTTESKGGYGHSSGYRSPGPRGRGMEAGHVQALRQQDLVQRSGLRQRRDHAQLRRRPGEHGKRRKALQPGPGRHDERIQPLPGEGAHEATNPKKGLDEDPGWVEISGTRPWTRWRPRCGRWPARRPPPFAHCFGFASWGNIVSDEAFCRAFGSPYDIQGRGHLCPVHIGASFVNGTFLDKQDVEYANYFLAIGGSLGPNTGSAHGMRAVSRAMERGMKLVVVDPRMSPKGPWPTNGYPSGPGEIWPLPSA